MEPLDIAVSGLQGVTVDNNVYMIGYDRFFQSEYRVSTCPVKL